MLPPRSTPARPPRDRARELSSTTMASPGSRSNNVLAQCRERWKSLECFRCALLSTRQHCPALVDWQHRDPGQLLERRRCVVRSNPRIDSIVVPPPLDARRCRHAEPVHVHDPAAHAELGHLGDRRDPIVAHALEGRHDLAETRASLGTRSQAAADGTSAAGIRVRSAVARAVVTRTRSRPRSSASIVSARSPAIS